MASRPFQFLEKKRSKIRKRAAKHFEGLAALSTHSTGRRAAVKTGCKPVHFSLDGCPLSCYFPGVWPLLRDTLSTSRSVGRGTGAFIYLPPFSETSPIFLFIPIHKKSACFPTGANGAQKAPHPVSPVSHASRYNTLHFASQSRVPNGGFAPLWKPPQEKAVRYPSTGRIPPFLVIQPSGCIG